MEDSAFSVDIGNEPSHDTGHSFSPDSNFEKSIYAFEKETDEKISRTISSIEKALSSWESIKKKPKALMKTVDSLRNFKKAISVWEKKALKSRTNATVLDRVRLLDEFFELCSRFDGVW